MEGDQLRVGGGHRVARAGDAVDEGGLAEQRACLQGRQAEVAVGGLALDAHAAALDEVGVLRLLPLLDDHRPGGVTVARGALRELDELLVREVGEDLPPAKKVLNSQGGPIVAEVGPAGAPLRATRGGAGPAAAAPRLFVRPCRASRAGPPRRAAGRRAPARPPRGRAVPRPRAGTPDRASGCRPGVRIRRWGRGSAGRTPGSNTRPAAPAP